MAEIFLSYSSEDRARVAPLVSFLADRGLTVWWDRNISPGDSFEEAIDKHILDAKCVVVVWSRNSVNSRWVKNEALEGMDRNILVPLLLDTIRIPVAFRQAQAADFTEWPDSVDDHEIEAFLGAISRIMDRELSPPAAESPRKPRLSRTTRWPLAVAALALLIAVGASLWSVMPLQRTMQSGPVSLGILRFRNISDPEDIYLTDSIGSELYSRLKSLEGMSVANEFASWDVPASLPTEEIASRLQVRFILEGKLINAGNSSRLLLELKSATDRMRWQREYDAGTGLQQLTQRISDHLLAELNVPVSRRNEDIVSQTYTANEGAFNEYLLGNDLLRRSSQLSEIEQARSHFANAVAEDNRFVGAYSGLCRANISLYEGRRDPDHFEDAERACNRALTLSPSEAEAYLALGELYLYSGQAELAEPQIAMALKLDPKNADGYLLRAEMLSELSEYEQAETAFATAIANQPGYWKSYNARGAFHFQLGEYQNAIRDFSRVTLLDPDNIKALNNLGTANYLNGDIEAAIEAWQKSVVIQPSRSALSNMGTGYYYLEEYDKAADMYRRAIEQAPDDHRLWGNLADVQRMGGRTDAAQQNYRRAIELAEEDFAINNSDAETTSRLAVYHAALKDIEQAQIYIEQTNRIGERNPMLQHDLAVAYILLGDLENARRAYRSLKAAGFPEVMTDSDPMFKILQNH